MLSTQTQTMIGKKKKKAGRQSEEAGVWMWRQRKRKAGRSGNGEDSDSSSHRVKSREKRCQWGCVGVCGENSEWSTLTGVIGIWTANSLYFQVLVIHRGSQIRVLQLSARFKRPPNGRWGVRGSQWLHSHPPSLILHTPTYKSISTVPTW